MSRSCEGLSRASSAGGDPHLDREEDRVAVGAHPLDHPPRRLGAVLARDAVLHLGEADAALVGEDAVAAVDRPAAGGEAGGEPRQRAGSPPGKRLAGRRERLQRPVLEHDVVEVGGGPAARARRRLGAVALEDQGGVGVGEGEELEVVVGVGALLEGVEDLLARPRRVDPVEGEGGDAAQGHRRDRAERADPDPRRAQQLRVGGGAELAHAAVGEDQLEPPRPGRRCCAASGAGAVGAGRDRAGDRLAVDVAEVLHRQAEPVQLLVEVGEDGPRADLDQAGGGIGVDDAAQRLDPTIVPSVIAASVKECPEPATLTLRPAAAAAATASASSSRLAGRATSAGPAGLVPGPVAPLAPSPRSPTRRHRPA